MFNMLGAIAQLERELIKERMLVGIAKAKVEGKYKGRAPTARVKADKVNFALLGSVHLRSLGNSASAAHRCTES
jgi:DNA invertase Pin-like site-specific DNA recombinase